jgi:hypothetical protein
LSGTAVSLVGGDPGVPMSHTGEDHTTTRVLLALGTNNHLHGLENTLEHQLEPH